MSFDQAPHILKQEASRLLLCDILHASVDHHSSILHILDAEVFASLREWLAGWACDVQVHLWQP